ncbi:MAG TPA: Flp family type IVb pilin [Sphingomonadaceae bacterium]|nr:Flp family type IVb pilin [Sphingomonadaceae bacterium]
MIFTQLLRDQQGATAIEYGLIAALIAITIIVSLRSVGNEVNTTFTTVSSELETANAG